MCDVANRINARHASGAPSNDFGAAGVAVHQQPAKDILGFSNLRASVMNRAWPHLAHSRELDRTSWAAVTTLRAAEAAATGGGLGPARMASRELHHDFARLKKEQGRSARR